jgi:hypothetical protein
LKDDEAVVLSISSPEGGNENIRFFAPIFSAHFFCPFFLLILGQHFLSFFAFHIFTSLLRELQAIENGDCDSMGGLNSLDRERSMSLLNDDPKWLDTTYVLANYKTEPCKKPPRLCRQGYACPQFHNAKDKRRSPRKYKYRSTPCPQVRLIGFHHYFSVQLTIETG